MFRHFVSHTFINNFSSQAHYRFFNINAILCTCLKIRYLVLICKALALLYTNCAIWCIAFCPDQNFLNSFESMFLNLLDPVFNIFERVTIIDSKCKDDAMGAFVVRMGDSSKSFLSGGIPDLKLVLFAFKFYLLKFIINAYSCHMGKCKVVIRKSEQQAGLSDSRVPYNHHLKSFHFLIIEANSCITSKMEKMKSYEEELVELQRKYLTPGSPDKSKRATGKDNFNMSQRTSGV